MDEDLLMFACILLYAAITFVLEDDDDEEENDSGPDVDEIANAVGAFRRMRKRAFDGNNDEQPAKRTKHDYQRAYNCLQQDYLGPDPLYGAHYERIFRVTRGITERIMQVVGGFGFFEHERLITGEMGIHPEAKFHIALKTLAFGCASSAFIDYFQMGFTSGRDCAREFCRAVSKSELRDVHSRRMTRADARRVSALHESQWGVAGCLGCLDCMHIFWRLCPVAWQGQHKGKEGSPSIVLEAFTDYNLWIWHLTFGFPGTLNDINTWDQSILLRAFIDGTFTSTIDFLFKIADQALEHLFLLVDGICPELSRFVETLSVPITKAEVTYSDWQESARKSVERGFGVAQREWQILTRPIENWYEDDIECVVEACFILHNMMVEVRLERDQRESETWHQLEEDNEDDDEEEEEEEFVGRHDIDLDNNHVAPRPSLTDRIKLIDQTWPTGGSERAEAFKQALDEHFEEGQREWNDLYDNARHMRLRQAIIQALGNK